MLVKRIFAVSVWRRGGGRVHPELVPERSRSKAASYERRYRHLNDVYSPKAEMKNKMYKSEIQKNKSYRPSQAPIISI
jgi:hypothetical protein